ncbi:MAG: hypothetical protein R3F39_03210 [Myxococcota bacterium]
MNAGILVTGFGPFLGRDGQRIDPNPSGEIALSLNGTRLIGHPVTGVVLPVIYEGVAVEVPELLARWKPALVIALGAGHAGDARLEQFASAAATSDRPDNAGQVARHAAPSQDAPARLRAPIDAAGLAALLATPELPVRPSHDAGGYVCNAAYYALLTACPPEIPACFLHLPWDRQPSAMQPLVTRLAAALLSP